MSNRENRYYLAQADDLGILLVDRFGEEESDNDATIGTYAEDFPDVIYFAVEPVPALHAHIASESSDCDGRYSRTYVIEQNDEELNGSPFDGYDGESAFRLRVLDYIGSTTPEFGGTFTICPGGDLYTWSEATDEGARYVEATFCRDDDADEKSTQRDHSAEAAGY